MQSTVRQKPRGKRATHADCPLEGCEGEMKLEKITERLVWNRCDTCGRALEGEPRGRAA